MAIPIFSIVAQSSKTGKTTLIIKLIPELKKRGLRVAVVKHDAHDFEVDREGKDSHRITQAGADITAITNEKHAAIILNRPTTTAQLLSKIDDVDIIFTEGYRFGEWPKIGICRSDRGAMLPESPNGYFAVMSDIPLDVDATQFHIDDVSSLAELIVKTIQNK